MQNILCLDIGSGTQDVFYYQSGKGIENCPKFILPSPAVALSREISRHTAKGNALFLYGKNMGGGFSKAVHSHIQAGLPICSTPSAAYALADDLDKVRSRGVEITTNCPEGYASLYLADFSPGFWRAFLQAAGLDYPDLVLACAQDHGFHPQKSNRRGRFALWEKFLDLSGGDPEGLVFPSPPEEMTRLKAIKEDIGGGLVSDSGSAAVLGALFDAENEKLSRREGICVLNIGNSHTIAFLIYADRIWGVYEHHTGMLDEEKLRNHLGLFRSGRLSDEEVFADKGHGCFIADLPPEASFATVLVLGPKRGLMQAADVHYPCPGGDMMLAGCFGLLKGYLKQKKG